MGTLRFFEEVVSFKIRRTFGFADYKYLRFVDFLQAAGLHLPPPQKITTAIYKKYIKEYYLIFRLLFIISVLKYRENVNHSA